VSEICALPNETRKLRHARQIKLDLSASERNGLAAVASLIELQSTMLAFREVSELPPTYGLSMLGEVASASLGMIENLRRVERAHRQCVKQSASIGIDIRALGDVSDCPTSEQTGEEIAAATPERMRVVA
jgi:hypothetical protein